MKQMYRLLMLFSALAATGCGSSKVVVDEDEIRAQIAKVEAEEQAHRAKQPAETKQQQPVHQSEADPGAEGSN